MPQINSIRDPIDYGTTVRTNENPIHYKVQIASGDRVPIIQKDETVEIRLNGRNQSTRWIRIFASFKVNTFETFEYAEKDIGDIDEVSVRIRNIDSVLNKGETDLHWDIRAIFVTTSQKNFCFAIKDELNTDVRCDFYLPGYLYRIEIITDGSRDAKDEISEIPSVRLLHGAAKTRQIKLINPINRLENRFKGTGTDIFLKPGKCLNGIDGVLLTNTKDQKIISNWKIGKISAYLCRKLKADASGVDQFHWENGIYWNDIALNDNMVNLSHIGNDSTPCETPIPPIHQPEDAIHGIKRNRTLRLNHDDVVTAPTQPKPNLGKVETQKALYPEEKVADVTVLSSDDTMLEAGSVSLVSRIRSPKPSISKVVNSATNKKSTNENQVYVATNEQSEGVLTETEDIDIESSNAASQKEIRLSEIGKELDFIEMQIHNPKILSKKIMAKSRENLEINRLEDGLNKKKKNDEELARKRFEEQKKRHEEQAERLRKAKSERQALLERLEKERLERERKRKEEDEIYASRVKREREEEAKKEKLLRASDLKKRLEAEQTKNQSLSQPKELKNTPISEEKMNLSRSSSMSTIIGFNSDNEYGGRYAGKLKTMAPYKPDYNPAHPIEDMKSHKKIESNMSITTEAQTETVNFDMNPTYKTFATKDIGVSPIATITPQFKETITINRKIVKDLNQSPPPPQPHAPSPPSVLPAMTTSLTNSETENEVAEISQHISAALSRRSSMASSPLILELNKPEVKIQKKTEEIILDNKSGSLHRDNVHTDLRVFTPDKSDQEATTTLSLYSDLIQEETLTLERLRQEKKQEELDLIRKEKENLQLKLDNIKEQKRLTQKKLEEERRQYEFNEMNLKLDFEKSEKKRIEAEIFELKKTESVATSLTGSVIGFDESEHYTPKQSRGRVKIMTSDGKVSRQPSRKSSISNESSSSSDTEQIIVQTQSPPIPAERSFKSGTSNRTPRIYGKARNKGSKRPNTVYNPILDPYFKRNRRLDRIHQYQNDTMGNKNTETSKSSFKFHRAPSVCHSVLNAADVIREDKGCQAYFPDENVPIQQMIIKQKIQSVSSENGSLLSNRKMSRSDSISIQSIQYSIDSLKDEIKLLKVNDDDNISQATSKQFSSSITSDVLQIADLKNVKKVSRSSSTEEQIFDVSILTKSCSFKKEKIQKYKLFAALIGTHGKTDWKEINANLQANKVDHIHVRNKSIGRIQAISLLNPDGKIFKSTMFDMIQVLYDDIESNTMNIKDTFSILRSSETANNVNFLKGVKYRLTTQTEAKWFSGTNEDIILKLIGSRASTDEIRIENRGNVAQTNQIDQFDIAHEDVGDIIGVLFRIDHKETFLSKKPKWSLHSISIETCRKLSNEQAMWENKRQWKVSSTISTEQFVVGEMQSTSINFNERKI